jgi:hypothetical protein
MASREFRWEGRIGLSLERGEGAQFLGSLGHGLASLTWLTLRACDGQVGFMGLASSEQAKGAFWWEGLGALCSVFPARLISPGPRERHTRALLTPSSSLDFLRKDLQARPPRAPAILKSSPSIQLLSFRDQKPKLAQTDTFYQRWRKLELVFHQEP